MIDPGHGRLGIPPNKRRQAVQRLGSTSKSVKILYTSRSRRQAAAVQTIDLAELTQPGPVLA